MAKQLKRVLEYYNRKTDAVIFDASTVELEAAAFLKLFKLLDEEWDVYSYGMTEREKDLYDQAKLGDAAAANQLLTRRQRCEYEEWRFRNVQ